MKITTTTTVPIIKSHLDSDYYYLSGAQLAYQLIGEHNEGLLSLSEYLNYFDYLRIATSKPFILDGQAGFGNPLNTFHSIVEMENHGADIIILNDQTHPSHTDPKQQRFISINQFAGRLKAALDAHHHDYSHLWIKLDGISHYDQQALHKRLQLLHFLGFQDIIVDQKHPLLMNKMHVHYYDANQQTILN